MNQTTPGGERDAMRDVRTMLLCKVHGSHDTAYQQICRLGDGNPDNTSQQGLGAGKAECFFTVGAFDAMVLYKVDLRGRERNWLEQLLWDKQEVFRQMSSDVRYHPLHLVANLTAPEQEPERAEEFRDRREKIQRFWSPETAEKLPFLVVTMVYGAYRGSRAAEGEGKASGNRTTYEDWLWKELARIENEHGDCQHMDRQYVVYNSINLCDLVVLWRTSGLTKTLRETMKIRLYGNARKTYHFIDIPMTGDGQLQPRVKSLLLREKEEYPILIRGTIRNYDLFYRRVYLPMFGGEEELTEGEVPSNFCAELPRLDEKTAHVRLSYGENDFLITAATDGRAFWNLMTFFLQNSAVVDSACWYIFTEFQQDYQKDRRPGVEKGKDDPSDILSREYERYLAFYQDQSHAQYPWMDALLELVSIHAQIDKYPVLHGPSYLIWGCLHVLNQYLAGEVADEKGIVYQGGTLDRLLQRSQWGMERFVRRWSQLTDQITRMDDVIFHHLGGSSAIYSTLSESILELYHFFLSRFSTTLMRTDGNDIPAEPVYGFLLVPTMSQTMRISHVLAIPPDMAREKQIYIIEFPQRFAYVPEQFVLQLAHECLHIFGDRIRQRLLRFDAILSYVSLSLAENSFPEVRDQETLAYVVYSVLLADTADLYRGREDQLDDIWAKDTPAELPEGDREESLYLRRVITELKEIVYKKILTPDTYRALCEAVEADGEKNPGRYADENGIYSEDAIHRWIMLGREFPVMANTRGRQTGPDVHIRRENSVSFEEILDSCEEYFRECYADAMTIKLLGILPGEYFSSFTSEARFLASSRDAQGVRLVQRIAIVLTACLEAGLFREAAEKLGGGDVQAYIKEELRQAFPTREQIEEARRREVQRREDSPAFSEDLAEDIYRCMSALNSFLANTTYDLADWPPIPEGGDGEQGRIHYDSPAALATVVDYVRTVLGTGEQPWEKGFVSIRQSYNTIIREGNFFGPQYYQKIFDYHGEIVEPAVNSAS